MKTLYFDCFAGASGNMILGALVALGVDEKRLVEELKKLDISDFDIEFTTKDKSGIAAIHADVKVPHEHAHRHLHTIEKIINDSRLADSVKARAIKIFTKLAEAEAKVHGIDIKKVHFHEVGAMDAIVDVVGACIGFEMLGIEKFLCSKIHTGSGFVKMAHGKFPVPPPAVAEILQTVKAPLYQTEIEGELMTPTGAAIIATVCEFFGAMPEMRINKTAYGAGTREYKDFPNVLRVILGEQNTARDYQKLLKDDQNIITDDQNIITDYQTHYSDNKKHIEDDKNRVTDGIRNIIDDKNIAGDDIRIITDNKKRSMDDEKYLTDREKLPIIEENQVIIEKNIFIIEENQSPIGKKPNAVDKNANIDDENQLITEVLTLIETNLDDISSEILGFVMEKSFAVGALDCWFTPIQMKKNRPAVKLSILCGEEKKDVLTDLIFSETTTLGVRFSKIERQSLPRETVQIEIETGKVDVKVAKYGDKVVNAKPEYDQIREIALKSNKSFRQTEREILEKLK